MLIKRVQEAQNYDNYAQYVLKEGNLIYVSPRNNEDLKKFYKSVDIARIDYRSEIIILPKPLYSLSGTFIRSLPINQREFYKQTNI
jgi:hypothetical protein